MPDIVVHTSMGDAVYNALGLDLNRNIYDYGLLGPDPLLFGLSAFSGYSSIMHRRRAADFLVEMARRCRIRDEFSYLAGFLCHYALDSLAHPYIIARAAENIKKASHLSFMHIAIEQRLDVMDGGEIKIPPFPSDSIREMFNRSVEAVYGWKNVWNNLRFNYWVMKPFYALVGDRHGILDKLLGWTNGPAAMFSYKSSVCDGIDLDGFRALYERSISDAIDFITCADRFVHGQVSEEKLRDVLGDRPYL